MDYKNGDRAWVAHWWQGSQPSLWKCRVIGKRDDSTYTLRLLTVNGLTADGVSSASASDIYPTRVAAINALTMQQKAKLDELERQMYEIRVAWTQFRIKLTHGKA